jgi:hypothetical protein
MAFVVAALCIAGVGGALGCAAVLPLNGLTTGIIDWQTFSHLAFAFCFTPLFLAAGSGVRPADGARRRCPGGDPGGAPAHRRRST